MSKKRIQIFGLRCSGTNYLKRWLETNFQNVEVINYYAFKHVWNAKLLRHISKNDDIEILVIVRNPFDWIRSVNREPHHCPDLLGLSLSRFLRAPFIAYPGPLWNSEIKSVRNRVKNSKSIEDFENILELRNKKNQLLHQIIKDHSCLIINYELLRDNPAIYFNKITSDLGLIPERELSKIEMYKYTSSKYKQKLRPRISPKDLEFINSGLNWELENDFGYAKSDYTWDILVNTHLLEYQYKWLYQNVKHHLSRFWTDEEEF